MTFSFFTPGRCLSVNRSGTTGQPVCFFGLFIVVVAAGEGSRTAEKWVWPQKNTQCAGVTGRPGTNPAGADGGGGGGGASWLEIEINLLSNDNAVDIEP